MDYIIYSPTGIFVKKSINQYIQQGSTGVNKFFVGINSGPVSTYTAQAVFTLPNQEVNTGDGTYKEHYPYEADDPENPPTDYSGGYCSGWVFTLTTDQTTYPGLLFVAIRVFNQRDEIIVNYPFTMVINETGVMPDTPSGLDLEQIDSYLLNLQELVNQAIQGQGIYVFKGSKTVSQLNGMTTLNPNAIRIGDTYNVTNSGTLNAGNVEVLPGDNVAWTGTQWDKLATDMSSFVTTNTEQTITANKTINDAHLTFDCESIINYQVYNDGEGNFRIHQVENGQTNNNYINFGQDGSVSFPNSISASDLYLSNGLNFLGTECKINLNGNIALSLTQYYSIFYTIVRPSGDNNLDLGLNNRRWRHLFLAGQLKDGNNNDYGLVFPDTTGWTANKTIATTDQFATINGQPIINGGNIQIAPTLSGLFKHTISIKLSGSQFFSLAYHVIIIDNNSSAYTATTELARFVGERAVKAQLYADNMNLSGEKEGIPYTVLRYYYSGSGNTIQLKIMDENLTASTLNIVEISDSVSAY